MKSHSPTMDGFLTLVGDDDATEGPLEGGPLARVSTLENEFEAEIVRDALDKHGIPCLIQTFRETAFDGLFIPQRSWGVVITKEERAEEALAVVKAVRESYQRPDEAEEGGEG